MPSIAATRQSPYDCDYYVLVYICAGLRNFVSEGIRAHYTGAERNALHALHVGHVSAL